MFFEDQNGNLVKLNPDNGDIVDWSSTNDEVHLEEIQGPQYRYRNGFEYRETRGNKVDIRYGELEPDLSDREMPGSDAREESLRGEIGGAVHPTEEHMVKILGHIEDAITLLNEVYGSTYSLHKGDKQEVHIGDRYSFHKGDRFTYEEGHGGDDAVAVSWGSTKEFNYGNSFTVNYTRKPDPNDHTAQMTGGSLGPIKGAEFDLDAAMDGVNFLDFMDNISEGREKTLVEVTHGNKYEKTTGVTVDVHGGMKNDFFLGGSIEVNMAVATENVIGVKNENFLGGKYELSLAHSKSISAGITTECLLGPRTTWGTETMKWSAMESDISTTDLNAKITKLATETTNIAGGVVHINNRTTKIDMISTEIEKSMISIENDVLNIKS